MQSQEWPFGRWGPRPLIESKNFHGRPRLVEVPRPKHECDFPPPSMMLRMILVVSWRLFLSFCTTKAHLKQEDDMHCLSSPAISLCLFHPPGAPGEIGAVGHFHGLEAPMVGRLMLRTRDALSPELRLSEAAGKKERKRRTVGRDAMMKGRKCINASHIVVLFNFLLETVSSSTLPQNQHFPRGDLLNLACNELVPKKEETHYSTVVACLKTCKNSHTSRGHF